uniref:VPS9 domain-containing protein n=1 Tax=Oryzias latipes TaxID=8090 RepID=A0A3P9HQ31_ORYLA
MMEASIVSQDPGLTRPVTGALESAAIPSPSILSQPPDRPCRPRPPTSTSKSSMLPSRPPLPASSAANLPSASMRSMSLSSNPPPPSLPPPLSPIIVTQFPQQSSSGPVPFLSPPRSLPPPLSPTDSPTPCSSQSPPPGPVIPLSSPAPPVLSSLDKLVGSVSIWQLEGLTPEKTAGILEKEAAGMFLVHSTDGQATAVSVRLPEEQGAPRVLSLMLTQHRDFIHLEGSALVFDDIFQLILFYCSSRDILTILLRLPQAVTTTTQREELQVISAMGADFWTSELNQKLKERTNALQLITYLHVSPVTVEERSTTLLNLPRTPKRDSATGEHVTSCLQNGQTSQSVSAHGNNSAKRFKRPPPRPPSLDSGVGLLFSSSSLPQNSTFATHQTEKKEGGREQAGKVKERRSVPPPSRPPVPLQGRCAPCLPPAPLPGVCPRKQTDQDEGEKTGREENRNPAIETKKEQGEKKGEEKTEEGAGPPTENATQGARSPCEEEERTKEEQEGKMEQKEVKLTEDKHQCTSPCPQLSKRPSRPIPPPRTKAISTGPGMKGQPPQAARRSDVSLFSPQGGAALGADQDSCDTSSTEEEGEPSQERGPNCKNLTESCSPKTVLRRTPTTFMLHKARHLSAVVSGLMSHDRRLTKRLVELARDPLSYFGNLVKEHRAFTLETMMKHMTSTELLQEIRLMMTQLKNYLLQSSELQAMLEPQQCTQDKLESIVEAALCKSVLKPLREPIYKTLEKLHTDAGCSKQLASNQSAILGSTTTALGITTSVPEAPALEKISIKLNDLHQEYSPQRKIQLLLKTCKIIYDSMSVSHPGRAHGADDFLPVMMYVLARSNLSALQLDVEYMMELMDPTLTLGEGSYYLTTTYGALEHIKTFDQQRSVTRQLSREVQDSIHRWERRRTLNQEQSGQGSVRDFLTVYCPAFGTNPKTMGIFPSMTMQQLAEQCAARYEQDSYILSVYMDGVRQPISPTDLALSVKNGCLPGAYCFLFHPVNQPSSQRSCPIDPPPDPPAGSRPTANLTGNTEPEVEETLINL